MLAKARILAYSENGFIRYLIAGCFNTALSFVVYTAMILIGVNYLAANFIAWALALLVSFLLNSRFVFRGPASHRRFPIFVLSNIFVLLLSMMLLSILVGVFSMNPIAAPVIVIPIVVVVNFLASKHLVFR